LKLSLPKLLYASYLYLSHFGCKINVERLWSVIISFSERIDILY